MWILPLYSGKYCRIGFAALLSLNHIVIILRGKNAAYVKYPIFCYMPLVRSVYKFN